MKKDIAKFNSGSCKASDLTGAMHTRFKTNWRYISDNDYPNAYITEGEEKKSDLVLAKKDGTPFIGVVYESESKIRS